MPRLLLLYWVEAFHGVVLKALLIIRDPGWRGRQIVNVAAFLYSPECGHNWDRYCSKEPCLSAEISIHWCGETHRIQTRQQQKLWLVEVASFWCRHLCQTGCQDHLVQAHRYPWIWKTLENEWRLPGQLEIYQRTEALTGAVQCTEGGQLHMDVRSCFRYLVKSDRFAPGRKKAEKRKICMGLQDLICGNLTHRNPVAVTVGSA